MIDFETAFGLPSLFGYIFIFIFGALVGSFLNVVIHRVPLEKSIVFPNSACPNCGKNIRFYDNIPIFSWLLLGGKCRNCRASISIRYPAVELLTAIIFLLHYYRFGISLFLPVSLIFSSAIIALIFIDAKHYILPNVITYPLLIFSLVVRLIFPLFITAEYFTDLSQAPINSLSNFPLWLLSLFGAVFGGLLGGGFLWILGELWKRLRGVDAMGLGDVKMMFAVGALLGWKLTFLAIFIGAFSGSIGGILLLTGKKDSNLQTQIPFGIFLGIGSIAALLFGDWLINWYLQTFLP